MKKLLALTTTLLIAACSAGTAAFASAENTGELIDYYPDNFTKYVKFENLADYAVSNGKYAFLQDGKVYEYKSNDFNEVYGGNKAETEIKALYYSPEGVLCYGNGESVLILETNEPADFTPEVEHQFFIDNLAYQEDEGKVWVSSKEAGNPSWVELEGFSNLKKFGNTAYAVKNNALHTLSGTDSTPVELSYEEFADAKRISAAGAQQALTTFGVAAPKFVTVKSGVYKTKVDLSSFDEQAFKTNDGDTVKTGENETALLLFTLGADNKISVITGADKQCYILNSQNVQVNTERQPVKEVSLDATADFNGKIYACPAILGSAELKEITAGEHLTVTGEVLKSDNPELYGDFYKVEFVNDKGEKASGYVPFGYLTPFHFDEKEPIVTPDPDYTQKDNVKTVVLVIVVIVLVLAACGYIVYVATKKKNPNQK